MLISILPKWLVNLLFRSFEAREVFLAQVTDLRKNHPQRPIAFAAHGAGWIEFMAVRLFLLEKFGHEFELRLATRIPSFLIEPFSLALRRVAAFFGLVAKPKSRIRMCSQELMSGHPIILNFESTERRKSFQTPLGEIELAYLAEQNPNLLVVPLVFVWRRRRRLEEGENQNLTSKLWKNFKAPFISPWNLLLGDPYQPTDLRKLLIMLRQYARSTLRLAPPIEISEFVPKTLRRKVLVSIQVEKRVILGPTYRSTKLVGESIFRGASFQKFIRSLAAEEGVPELTLLKRAQKIFNEISAKFSYFTFEYLGWVLHQVFTKIFDDVSVDDRDFDRLREASKEGPLVFIPCHKSYVDFLLLSYLLYRKEILPPHIAAGINLNFFPVGRMFKSGGAFFIRRSFRGNVLYAEVLKRYIAELLSNRSNVEFFIEGTRSRNGKLAPPKFGMIKMIVDSYLDGLVTEKVRIVPVSICYDRVTEERMHKRELEGQEKVKESALGIVKSSKVLFRNYGKVHVRFSDPLPLEKVLEQTMGEGSASVDTRKLGIQKIAFEVCHRINGVTPVTSFGLVCAILLAKPGAALARSDLETLLLRMKEDLKQLEILMTQELREDFMGACRRALARLVEDGIVRNYQTPLDTRGVKIPERQRIAALYYKNSVIHALVPIGIAGLARGNKEKLLELRAFLQFEFFFAEKDAFLRQILALPSNVMKELYAFMIDDVLENIQLGLQGLIKMQGLWLESREWKSRLMKFGLSGIVESTVSRLESVNTQSFAAFVEMAQNRNWLRSQPNQTHLLTPSAGAELTEALAHIKALRKNPDDWELLREQYLGGNETPSSQIPAPSTTPS